MSRKRQGAGNSGRRAGCVFVPSVVPPSRTRVGRRWSFTAKARRANPRWVTIIREFDAGLSPLGSFIRLPSYILGLCGGVILVVPRQRFRNLLRGELAVVLRMQYFA